jgi:ABC-type multidrug transport system fused ATPase/permease subunit
VSWDFRGVWQGSTIGRSANLLSKSDKRKILFVALGQICLGGLDLLAVLMIGALGAHAVGGEQSSSPGGAVNSILLMLRASDESFQTQIVILSTCAALLLTGRTLLSIIFTRRMLFFLSRRGALISLNLTSRLLAQPLLKIQSRSTQDTLFSLTRGVETITLGILATSVNVLADVSLLLVMSIGLFIVEPTVAFWTFLVFSFVGFALYRLMHSRAHTLGFKNAQLNIQSNEKIVEVFSSYRESVVRNRRNFYAREIGRLRLELANTMAEINFMPYISKYVIETTVILGALLISSITFVLRDATQGVGILSIFLAAGLRIAPAVLRVQQSAVQIRGGIGMAGSTLDLIDEIRNVSPVEMSGDDVDLMHKGFSPVIRIYSATLTYPGNIKPAIHDINLEVPEGSLIAFVGPSGAGKSTIVDVLLGILTPDSGSVNISGLPPLEAISKWPGAVSYVPQDVLISNGTIRENVALGYPLEVATDDLVKDALRIAHLDEFVAELPQGLDTAVGERGTKLSGGQRQRLGIARAMFTKPSLLVLDEATSALDGETEAVIAAAIHSLRGSTTVVMIAHRLSTIRSADTVVYLSEGKVVRTGRFEEIRKEVPDFDRQANLMGL